jgi:hypothetical protein
MTLSKLGMAAVAALLCTAAHAETAAPAKLMQLAQAKPAAPAACTMIYLPVCGIVKGKPVNYSNECEAKLAKAKPITQGRCEPKA